jgi:hypothetical protein
LSSYFDLKCKLSLTFLPLCIALSLSAQPALFYSDLDSGPNSGGERNGGAYVTLYGKGFGASQGASFVTVGGVQVSAYPLWTDSKIAFQLGPQAASGNILVTTPTGVSAPLQFTVRPGAIYFASPTGSDSNNGTLASPWATLTHAATAMSPGDIIYAMNGVAQTYDDGTDWSTCMLLDANSGSAGNPKAMVVYPGATATLGSSAGCATAVRSKGNGNHYWTFAGFTVLGGSITFNPYDDHDWRIVGNDMSCPNGNDQAGCLTIGGEDDGGGSYNIKIYGNNIHNVATNLPPENVTALYHGVYLSEINHNIDFGWNTVAFVNGGRCVQQNVNEGGGSYSLLLHDNVIHDCQLDGIVMTTVNPSLGTVALYNNIIYNTGKGPANTENSGAWNCLNIQGWMAYGASGESGVVEIYNNTMYACGLWISPPYGESSGGILWEDGNSTTKGINLVDNVIFLTTGSDLGLPYVANSDRAAAITGSNNLFFGNGSSLSGQGPSMNSLTQSTFADPLFVNATVDNFHLSPASPAAQGGATTASIADFDGLPLPQGQHYPIGAFAYAGQVVAPAGSIAVSVSPASVSLPGGQTQKFAGVVTNSANPSVTWTLNPLIGTLSSSGVYTAPAIARSAQTVLVTARSAADATKSAVASVNLVPISVTASPLTASLAPDQSQQFDALVTGTNNSGLTWSLIPHTGTLTPSGLYTAPGFISVATAVTIRAASVVDSTKFSAAKVTLSRPMPVSVVSVTVSPATATLSAGQTQQFSAAVTGSPTTAVTWTLSPAIGSLSSTGLYTAPAEVTTQQAVTITATSLADTSKFASATVSLSPAANQALSVAIAQTASGWQLTWTAPPGRPFNDWIGLSSLDAPNWWAVWNEYTNGAATGSFTIPTPSVPGIYELRYFGPTTYTILARSNLLPIGIAGFAVSVSPASAPVVAGGNLSLSWTAGQGRTSSDYIGLFATGATSDNPLWWEPTSGLPSGTAPGWGAPTTPGAYEFRYIAGNGYLCLAVSSPISIQ